MRDDELESNRVFRNYLHNDMHMQDIRKMNDWRGAHCLSFYIFG